MRTLKIHGWTVLLAVVLIGSCAQPPKERIIGEWKGTDHTGETASLVFSEDGTARMVTSDMVLDGSSVGGTVTWRMDDSQDPIHLDLVVTNMLEETQVLPMIMRFLSDGTLQLRNSEGMTTRPTGFSDTPSPDQIILTRQ